MAESDEKYLIRREEIDAWHGTEKVHFLNSSARRINKSLGDATGLRDFGFHLIEVPPGYKSTELHKHFHEDECVFILEGNGKATIGDEVFDIGPGDFIGYRAGGEAHDLSNTGNGPLRCIVVGSRLQHDVADYPRLNKRIFRNQGLPWTLVDTHNLERVEGAGKK